MCVFFARVAIPISPIFEIFTIGEDAALANTYDTSLSPFTQLVSHQFSSWLQPVYVPVSVKVLSYVPHILVANPFNKATNGRMESKDLFYVY